MTAFFNFGIVRLMALTEKASRPRRMWEIMNIFFSSPLTPEQRKEDIARRASVTPLADMTISEVFGEPKPQQEPKPGEPKPAI